MSSAAFRLTSRVLGALSITVGIINWLWIFYAWDAAWHMGSPLRRHSKHFVASLTGDEARMARDAHSTGLVLIDVLGNTFWVMFASGAFMVLVGLLLIIVGSRLHRLPRTTPGSSPDKPLGQDPLPGSA